MAWTQKITHNLHWGIFLFMGLIISVFVGCLIYALTNPNPTAMVEILSAMWDLL